MRCKDGFAPAADDAVVILTSQFEKVKSEYDSIQNLDQGRFVRLYSAVLCVWHSSTGEADVDKHVAYGVSPRVAPKFGVR